MTDEPWRKQYDLIFKILTAENTRFWSRFNISILINGGLIVAFSSLLSFAQKSLGLSAGTIGLFAISTVGIIVSVLWFKITEYANSWAKYYHDKLKNIEQKNIEEELRVFPHTKGIIKGSITSTALWYPKLFIIFWSILFGMLAALLLKIIVL